MTQSVNAQKKAQLIGKGYRALELLPTAPGGRSKYRIVPVEGTDIDETAVSEIIRDYEQVLNAAIEHGIFFSDNEDYSATSALLRCELLFELWKRLGAPLAEEGSVEDSLLDQVAPGTAYYREAIRYFLSKSPNLEGLYSWRDVQRPITIAEVGYLLYYVFGREAPLGILDLALEGETVSLLRNRTPEGQEQLENRLKEYKREEFFDSFLEDIREGKRYTPLPLFHAFEALKKDFEGVEEDWLLREITKEEAQIVLDALIN